MKLTLAAEPRLLRLDLEPGERRPAVIDCAPRLGSGETLLSASANDGGRGIATLVTVSDTDVILNAAGLVNGMVAIVIVTALGSAGAVVRCVLVVRCLDPAALIAPVLVMPTGALINRGEYVVGGVYQQDHVVRIDGAWWVAMVDAPAQAPGVEVNEWAPWGGAAGGAFLTVAGIAPDQAGNIPLAADDVGADPAGTAAQLVEAEALARQAAIVAAVNALINGAPGALDQLNELSAAMGNDANFSATVLNALAGKEPVQTAMTQAQAEDATSDVATKTSGRRLWQALNAWWATVVGLILLRAAHVVIDPSTTRTLSAADAGTIIFFTSAGAITVTYPVDVNIQCTIVQFGTGTITFVTGGTTLVSEGAKLKSNAQYAPIYFVTQATNVGYLCGSLKA